MEINRNQWFVIGIVVFLIGLQLRAVSAYWLNEDTTRFLAEQSSEATTAERSFLTLASAVPSAPRKVIQPPDWAGWCLVSIGSVVILQSLAMRKPG
jgi:hypothetical protein